MLKRPTFLFFILASMIVIVLFRVKYEVSALETTKERIIIGIQKNKEVIHVLRAEWSHLNEPKRIQTLCKKYLPHLQLINSSQLITTQDMLQTPTLSSEKNLDTYITNILEKELEVTQ